MRKRHLEGDFDATRRGQQTGSSNVGEIGDAGMPTLGREVGPPPQIADRHGVACIDRFISVARDGQGDHLLVACFGDDLLQA